MKGELGGKIMKELRVKTYSYLTDNKDEDKKAKATKKCVVKRKFAFKHYDNYLKPTELENKINLLQKGLDEKSQKKP